MAGRKVAGTRGHNIRGQRKKKGGGSTSTAIRNPKHELQMERTDTNSHVSRAQQDGINLQTTIRDMCSGRVQGQTLNLNTPRFHITQPRARQCLTSAVSPPLKKHLRPSVRSSKGTVLKFSGLDYRGGNASKGGAPLQEKKKKKKRGQPCLEGGAAAPFQSLNARFRVWFQQAANVPVETHRSCAPRKRDRLDAVFVALRCNVFCGVGGPNHKNVLPCRRMQETRDSSFGV